MVTRPTCKGPDYESSLLADWIGFSPEVALRNPDENTMISTIEGIDDKLKDDKTSLRNLLGSATAYYHEDVSDEKFRLDGVYLPPLSGGRKTKARRKHRRKTKNVKK